MEDERPEDCEGCEFRTPFTQRYTDDLAENKVVWLCRLCANTKAGNAAMFPSQYRDERNIFMAICYVGNAVITEIRERTR